MFAPIASAAEIVENFFVANLYPSDGTAIETGRIYTNTPQDVSYNSTDIQAQVYGAPLDLDARLVFNATNSASIAGSTAVRRWQILSGPASTATLFVDIGFKGSFQATGNGSASFTDILSVRSSPDAASADRILVFNGTDNNDTPPSGSGPPACIFTYASTVGGDLCYATSDVHFVDETFRSLAFTVTTGVPFALTLTLNATTAANGGLANVDFYDPSLQDVFIQLDGQVIPLSNAQGYSLQVTGIPEPTTLALLGLGLAGLAASRRRKQ